jgi:hypothetical protein
MGRPKKQTQQLLQPLEPEKRKIKEETLLAPKKRGRAKIDKSSDKDDIIEIMVLDKPTKKTKTKHVKTSKLRSIMLDDDFYPSLPNHHFPHGLESNLLKVIASLENSAQIADIMTNIQRFYHETVL